LGIRLCRQTLGQFFRDEIATPYTVDFHIGLPDSEFNRVSKLKPFVPAPKDTPSAFVRAMLADPEGLQSLAFRNTGGWFFDAPESWRAEIGGAGGISNARGLASMFGSLFNDQPLLSRERVNALRQPVSEGLDQTLLIRFADPDIGFSFGYTMNKMGGGTLLNERGQSLVDAAYACI